MYISFNLIFLVAYWDLSQENISEVVENVRINKSKT